MKIIKTSLVFCIFAFCTSQVNAATHENYHYEAPSVFNHNDSIVGILLLAENSEESLYGAQPEEPESGARSGELVIPGAKENEGKEKQCVTVCDEWGKNCVINPRTGTRKCRRMCKSFGKECF
ncbi:hypothetical protein IH785_19330 [candidate division KSB1 bacterium]|nr:hypothetical protein [candidate division KSB1 bacterium]